MIKKEAILLFSGGIDCSLSACLLAEEKYKVHLIHYSNGTGLSDNAVYRIRYNELKSVLGEENITLNEINMPGLFRKLSLSNIEEDFKKYGNNMICLGCRMGMHVETIIYALQNNIAVVADGSIKYQSHFPEQSNMALNLFKQLYKKYGIDYIHPVIDIKEKKYVKYRLLDYGISIQSLEDTCLFNNTFSKSSDDNIEKYILERMDFCEDYIQRKLNIVNLKSNILLDGKGVFMDSIYKVGGIILKSKKLLVVRKRTIDNRAEFIIPGGKPEECENDEETLKRELKEEINVNLQSMDFFGSFSDVAVFENIPINMNVYICDVKGNICPMSEIKEYIWIDRDYEKNNIQLGSILSKYIVPKLIDLDLM